MSSAINQEELDKIIAAGKNGTEVTASKNTNEQEPERTLTEFEQEQQQKGWNPNGTKSAEEWARAEPLYEELKNRGKEIKQLKRTVDQLVEYMKKQDAYSYDKAMRDLNEQRQQAIATGNQALVTQIDKEKESLPHVQEAKPEAVTDFEEKHASWLSDTSFEALEMQDWVFKRDKDLLKLGLPPDEHMRLLDEHLQKRFPNYFNPMEEALAEMEQAVPTRTHRPSAPVESGYSSNVAMVRTNKKAYSFNDLSPEQKQVARDFERMKVMKAEDYIKSLVKLGELK